jgi:Plant transposon protein.
MLVSICFGYPSIGMSFRALAFSFQMGDTTVGRMVKETVEILWEELHTLHMPPPTTKSLKKMKINLRMSGNFLMSLVVWMADGKHIRIACPTDWCNVLQLKKYYSVVLQGLVDSNYKFITADMGCFAKQSDADMFLASHLFSSIDGKRISFPDPDFLLHGNATAPYIMLEDEVYPLLPYLMKPYKCNSLTDRRNSFNKHLSRARKTMECAF